VYVTLRSLLIERAELATTEIVVMEVLAGVRSLRERRKVRAQLLGLPAPDRVYDGLAEVSGQRIHAHDG